MSAFLSSNAFWGRFPKFGACQGYPPNPVLQKGWIMINRKNEIKLRLNEDELSYLNECVRQTGWSREHYLRSVIKGIQPVEVPPLDYYEMIREIRRVGYNMRQVAQRAYTLNMVDAPEYERNAGQVLKLCDELNMVCLPQRGKR